MPRSLAAQKAGLQVIIKEMGQPLSVFGSD